MHTFETKTVGRLTVKVHLDEWGPDDPRKCGRFLTKIYHSHSGYNLGERIDPEDYEDRDEMISSFSEPEDFVFPLYVYEHGLVALSINGSAYPFTDRWDAGEVGFAVLSKKLLDSEAPGQNPETVVRQEIETLTRYFNGEAYGFTVEDEDGEEIESCWGFDDVQVCLSEGVASAKLTLSQDVEAEQFERNHFAL